MVLVSQPVPPIGHGIRRREDPRLLRGNGCYVGDIRLPGMLHAAFARCPHGHARITRLDLDATRALPGVIAAFGPDDLPALGRPMPATFQQPGIAIRLSSPLARGEVRCAGEAVAAIVADDPYSAADAAAAVEVEYELLPVVVDPEEALVEGAPRVHEDVPGNIAGRFTRGYGNIAGAMSAAPIVVREHFRIERAAGAAIEPRGAVAMPGGEDGIAVTVWASTQAPHIVRRCVAQFLELPPEKVRVITPDVGGGFGPKGRFYEEDAAIVLLAMHLNRPLSWQATRQEDMLSTYQGRGLLADAELAADRDGTILGLRVQITQDCGAYLPTAMTVPQNVAQHLVGPYRLPALAAEALGVYTNKAPLTPLRGGGRELGVFITERILDRLAQRLGLDPRVVRERNVLRPEEFPYDTGFPARAGGTLVYDSGDYLGCLERAHALIGYDGIKREQPEERRRGRYRGVAVTLFLESTGMDRETARVQIGADGQVSVTVGSPSNGQSHATTMAQLCAAYLGVPVESVSYHSGDTAAIAEGTGTFGSRMAVMAGNATALAARSLRELVLQAAGDELEVAEQDLEIVDGVVRVRGVPDRGITLSELAERQEGLVATEAFAPERPTAFAGGAHAAVVEVDVETGWVHLLRYLVVHDCGTVINPTVVEGQVHGGVAHGFGNVLGERMVYDDAGRLVTDSFQSYVMPLAEWLPSFAVEHHESPSPNNPEGIKGAGEGGTIGALATVTRAVEDALAPLEVRLHDLPLRYEALADECARLQRGNEA
jgi:carbon-monoxide dehydrogenase large subunit